MAIAPDLGMQFKSAAEHLNRDGGGLSLTGTLSDGAAAGIQSPLDDLAASSLMKKISETDGVLESAYTGSAIEGLIDAFSFNKNPAPSAGQNNAANDTAFPQKNAISLTEAFKTSALEKALAFDGPAVKLRENTRTVATVSAPKVRENSVERIKVATEAKQELAAIKEAVLQQQQPEAPKEPAAANAGGIKNAATGAVTNLGVGFVAGVVSDMIAPGSGPFVGAAMTAGQGLGSMVTFNQTSNELSKPIAKKGDKQQPGYVAAEAAPVNVMTAQTGATPGYGAQSFNKMMSSGPGFGNPEKMDMGSVELASQSLQGIEVCKLDDIGVKLDKLQKDAELSVAMHDLRNDKGVTVKPLPDLLPDFRIKLDASLV